MSDHDHARFIAHGGDGEGGDLRTDAGGVADGEGEEGLHGEDLRPRPAQGE
jgi:hypothetical protein